MISITIRFVFSRIAALDLSSKFDIYLRFKGRKIFRIFFIIEYKH